MSEKSVDQIRSDLWHKMATSPLLMVGLVGGQHGEPMTAQLDQDQVDTLFFFAHAGNRLAKGGDAIAHFVAKGHDFFASLRGTLAPDQDRALIDKLWNTQAEAWFAGGKTDPELRLLRFEIDDAEFWETDVSLSGRFKMLLGGTIRPGETSSHARVDTTAT